MMFAWEAKMQVYLLSGSLLERGLMSRKGSGSLLERGLMSRKGSEGWKVSWVGCKAISLDEHSRGWFLCVQRRDHFGALKKKKRFLMAGNKGYCMMDWGSWFIHYSSKQNQWIIGKMLFKIQ